MTLWLRRTTFNLMNTYYEEQNEKVEKQQKTLNPKNKEIARPNITTPTYTTKAPKK